MSGVKIEQLRALAVLAEAQVLLSEPQSICSSNAKESIALFWPPQAPSRMLIHVREEGKHYSIFFRFTILHKYHLVGNQC